MDLAWDQVNIICGIEIFLIDSVQGLLIGKLLKILLIESPVAMSRVV